MMIIILILYVQPCSAVGNRALQVSGRHWQARIFISRFKFLQFYLWFPKRINLFTMRKLAQKILFEVSQEGKGQASWALTQHQPMPNNQTHRCFLGTFQLELLQQPNQSQLNFQQSKSHTDTVVWTMAKRQICVGMTLCFLCVRESTKINAQKKFKSEDETNNHMIR